MILLIITYGTCTRVAGGYDAVGAQERTGRRQTGQLGREGRIRHHKGGIDGPRVSDETDTRFGGDAQALTTKVLYSPPAHIEIICIVCLVRNNGNVYNILT